MSCSQVRHELLEHFAFREELGPRSWPHLAHLESCADCRQEVGIDRDLIRQLRRALRERAAGSAPSEASWQFVRGRTIDRLEHPLAVRLVRWGGMLSAVAAASLMMFAVATAPATRLFPGTQSTFVASAARRAVPPVEDVSGWPAEQSNSDAVALADPPLPGWPKQRQMSDAPARSDTDPAIAGRMR